MEEQLEQGIAYSTKYALLTAEEYTTLNESISNSMGFDLGLPTERYAPIEPILAKTNIVYDEEGNESYDTIPVMPILPNIQEGHPSLLVGLTLIDSYIPYIQEV